MNSRSFIGQDMSKLSRFTFCALIVIMIAYIFSINIKMPLAGEDFSLQPWRYTDRPTTILGKIQAVYAKVISQAQRWNPRIGEALTSVTAAFPPMVFDILNTLMFIWLVFTLFVLSFGRFPEWRNPADVFALFSIFFLFITLFPLLGMLIFWKAGACNHTWGLIFLISFLLPFRINHYRKLQINKIGLIIPFTLLGFISGLSVENVAPVVLVFLIIYTIISILHGKMDWQFILPLLGLTVGTLFLLFSPATTFRRDYYGGLGIDQGLSLLSVVIERLTRIHRDILRYSGPLLISFSICTILFLILQKGKALRSRVDGEISVLEIAILLLISYFTVLAMMAVPYFSDQRKAFNFFWLILLSLNAWLLTKIFVRFFFRSAGSLGLVFLCALLVSQMVTIGKVYTQYDHENQVRMAIIQTAIDTGKREITLPGLTIIDDRIVETREILQDLGDRMAIYYGFDLVEINNGER